MSILDPRPRLLGERGLSHALADRLTGNTLAELTAAADKLALEIATATPDAVKFAKSLGLIAHPTVNGVRQRQKDVN